ncbi:membrane protein [Pilimelia terevasa]|uniref:Membrane protein n=1 Tax=Pilimelia terevasa TaxID=53372 RepID=A0A8J3FGD4_9ACTN|nr:PH domain-containing protein [Pilimelia terevasa]GGK24265.1 membrane protein [Pilimelia terevasa]
MTDDDAFTPWPRTLAWRPVSPRLVWVRLIRLWAAAALGVAALTAARLTLPDGLVAGLAHAGTWAVLAAAAVRSWSTVRAVRAWGYAERDHDLLVRHGLLIRRLTLVPYARMQFVDVSAGPLERAFKLATVTLHTASAASDAVVPGLAPTEARRLRDRLAALGADPAAGL